MQNSQMCLHGHPNISLTVIVNPSIDNCYSFCPKSFICKAQSNQKFLPSPHKCSGSFQQNPLSPRCSIMWFPTLMLSHQLQEWLDTKEKNGTIVCWVRQNNRPRSLYPVLRISMWISLNSTFPLCILFFDFMKGLSLFHFILFLSITWGFF